MISFSYQLIAPKIITPKLIMINQTENEVLVRPKYLALCHADQRYYRGQRSAEALKKKLPMALIHEAVGEVINDPKGQFEKGEDVVLIPNIGGESSEFIAENYQKGSAFRSSGIDGFMQEYVLMPHDRLVSAKNVTDRVTLSIAEFISVACHCVSRLQKKLTTPAKTVGIWGDGNLGYVVANVVRIMIPDAKIYIVGRSVEKLRLFTFADEVYADEILPDGFAVDHAFECTGGAGCDYAVNDIIAHINPEGLIMLMGVSENKVPIFTRDILEKGLTVVGSSRSGRIDFEQAVKLMSDNSFAERIRLIISDIMDVKSVGDISKAFEKDSNNMYKTVLRWNI